MKDMKKEKAKLREEVRATVKKLSPQEKLASDKAMFEGLLALIEAEEVESLLLFRGEGDEPKTEGLIEELLAMGISVCLPRCLKNRQMEAREITKDSKYVKSAFGILEPDDACPVVDKNQLDLIVVPALCYDEKGYRLGQGGGYYDRYLKGYLGTTVGFCREEVFQKALPIEKHDVPVEAVISEEDLSFI